ncbi:MAG TPA: type II toxin-antitoxin system MqsA family antitoxin [Gallionella sp.]|nr:type II toxin-antitoxin system MqsA family antitoxin [Gallionella sp.]
MSKEKRYCPQCDNGTLLVKGVVDKVISIDALSAVVPHVSGWHCPVCGECEFDDGEGKRYSAALSDLRKQADAERAASLRAIRKKLGLRQADAGKLFGGGVSAFSDYERGKTQPHKSTVLLLKLLDKHPELLDEVRAA